MYTSAEPVDGKLRFLEKIVPVYKEDVSEFIQAYQAGDGVSAEMIAGFEQASKNAQQMLDKLISESAASGAPGETQPDTSGAPGETQPDPSGAPGEMSISELDGSAPYTPTQQQTEKLEAVTRKLKKSIQSYDEVVVENFQIDTPDALVTELLSRADVSQSSALLAQSLAFKQIQNPMFNKSFTQSQAGDLQVQPQSINGSKLSSEIQDNLLTPLKSFTTRYPKVTGDGPSFLDQSVARLEAAVKKYENIEQATELLGQKLRDSINEGDSELEARSVANVNLQTGAASFEPDEEATVMYERFASLDEGLDDAIKEMVFYLQNPVEDNRLVEVVTNALEVEDLASISANPQLGGKIKQILKDVKVTRARTKADAVALASFNGLCDKTPGCRPAYSNIQSAQLMRVSGTDQYVLRTNPTTGTLARKSPFDEDSDVIYFNQLGAIEASEAQQQDDQESDEEEQGAPAPAPAPAQGPEGSKEGAPAPAPAPTPPMYVPVPTSARRAQLEAYRQSLYFVNIPFHNRKIIDMNKEITEALESDKRITLDIVGGSIPVAVALKTIGALPYMPGVVNPSVSLRPLPANELPAGANPAYELYVNGEPLRPARNFNKWGNGYLRGDLDGLAVFITTYPYRVGGNLDWVDKTDFNGVAYPTPLSTSVPAPAPRPQMGGVVDLGGDSGGDWGNVISDIFRFP